MLNQLPSQMHGCLHFIPIYILTPIVSLNTPKVVVASDIRCLCKYLDVTGQCVGLGDTACGDKQTKKATLWWRISHVSEFYHCTQYCTSTWNERLDLSLVFKIRVSINMKCNTQQSPTPGMDNSLGVKQRTFWCQDNYSLWKNNKEN